MAATASSTERRQHSFRTVRAPKPPLSNPAPSQVVPQASGPLYATASRMQHARSNELEWLWSCRLLLPLGSITCAADAHARRIQSRAESKSIEPRPFASFSAGAWPLGHSCKNATACETPGFAGLATKHGGEAAPTSFKRIDDWRLRPLLGGVGDFHHLLDRDRYDPGSLHRQLFRRLGRHVDQ